MLNVKRLIWYTFLVAIVIMILICTLAFHKTNKDSSIGIEVPIYLIPISEETQRDIWKQCDDNNLSYEFVLAIYQIEGDSVYLTNNVKTEIESLVYFRDYWSKQGFPDEVVYNLMLLSRSRGIEGCVIFMKDSESYDLDNYIHEVTEYKYYLEQTDSVNEVSEI